MTLISLWVVMGRHVSILLSWLTVVLLLLPLQLGDCHYPALHHKGPGRQACSDRIRHHAGSFRDSCGRHCGGGHCSDCKAVVAEHQCAAGK